MTAAFAQAEPADDGHYRPELKNFADRVKWIRVFVLDISRRKLERLIERDASTIATWEKGTRPHGEAEVAKLYVGLVKDIEPLINTDWILYGGARVVTYWGTPAVVENAQERLPMQLPPATTTPLLAVVE